MSDERVDKARMFLKAVLHQITIGWFNPLPFKAFTKTLLDEGLSKSERFENELPADKVPSVVLI